MAKKSCSCDTCVKCCETNPGWMSPADASKAIAAGFAEQLMRDWLEPSSKLGNDDRIYILCPASQGSEGDDAPEAESFVDYFCGWTKGACTFLKDKKCELHKTDFKPKQCREVFACDGSGPDNYDMARLWNTPEAQALVQRWQETVS
jgi:hypothetical protein